jgi:predicted RNase H-like HicB family nuclease
MCHRCLLCIIFYGTHNSTFKSTFQGTSPRSWLLGVLLPLLKKTFPDIGSASQSQLIRYEENLVLLTTALILAEEGGYIALNQETGTATQGATVEEAIANLKEATSLYLEEFPATFSHPTVITVK